MRPQKIEIFADKHCAWADLDGFKVYGKDTDEVIDVLRDSGLQVIFTKSEVDQSSWYPTAE